MSHAKKFVEAHGSVRNDESYDAFISQLLSMQPEGTKSHSAPDQGRTIFTFPDNSAAHVADFNGSGDLSAAECEEDAETMLAYLDAALGGEGKPKPEGGDENDEDEDENEDEDEEAMA